MEKKRIIRYFALVHFLTTTSMSLWTYSTNYFRELGYTAQQIGVLNAVGTFLSMIALPFIGLLSDKIGSSRKVYVTAVAVAIPLYLLIPALGQTMIVSFLPMIAICGICAVARQTTNSMMDSWAGGEMARLDVSFGSIRRFGSFGFVLMSVLGSLLIGPVLPTWSFAVISPVLALPLLWVISGKRGEAYTRGTPKEKASGTVALLKFVFGNYYFVSYLLFVIAFDAFLAILNMHMSYLMDYVGAQRSDIGYVGAVRATTEIVVFIIIGKAKKLPPLWVLLCISGVLLASEHLLYPSLTGLTGVLLVTLLSGVAGGFYYGLGANYVFKVVDRRAAGTAMAVLGVVRSLIGVFGTGFGGDIIERFGVLTLTTAVGWLIMTLTVLFMITCVIGRLILKKPYVTEQ